MYKNKLNDNRGGALIIVIVAIAIIGITIGTVSMQIINQVKSNKNSYDTMQSRYMAESGVENTISKIVNQVENKINNINNGSRSNFNNISSNIVKSSTDRYGKAKNKLILLYENISQINDGYQSKKDIIVKLNQIINNDYSSILQLNNDINDIKLYIIHAIASEDNSIKGEDLNIIYEAIGYLNDAVLTIYESEDIHQGHTALEISSSSYGGDNRYVTQGEIETKFIKDYGNEAYSFTVDSIQRYTGDVLKNTPSKFVIKEFNVEGYYKLKDKIGRLSDTKIRELEDALINLKDTINHIQWTNKNSVTEYEIELSLRKDNAIKVIDEILIKYTMDIVENELYKIYIEEMNNFESLTQENYVVLKEMIYNMDNIRKNLVELKCKLGFIATKQEDNINKPDSPDVNPPVNKEVYIGLDKYENILGENVSYTVEAIDEKKLDLIYENGDISNVEDFSLDIISGGNNNGYNYKVNAKVLFKTRKENNQFKTSYSIKSYDKINN